MEDEPPKEKLTTEERWQAKRKSKDSPDTVTPAKPKEAVADTSEKPKKGQTSKVGRKSQKEQKPKKGQKSPKGRKPKKDSVDPMALPIADPSEVKKLMALKHATHTNIICSELLKMFTEAIVTYGYVTKTNRLKLNLAKDHYVDACVMATSGEPFRIRCDLLHKKSVPEGEFSQRKGQHSEIVIPRGKMEGFLRFDKVRYFGKEYFIKGRMSSGYALLMDINGDIVKFDDMPRGFKTPKLSNLRRVSARSSCLVIRDTAMPIPMNSKKDEKS